MASILFFIQSNKAPAAIYVRFRDGRLIDAKAKTGFFVNPQDWSVKKGQPINLKDESLKVLNEDLLNLQTRLLNFYNKSGDSTINSTWLKEFLSPTKVLESIPTDLVDYFNYYAKHKHSDVQASTRTKWNVIKHLIERFQRASNTVLKIKNVNADFKLQFERFCKGEKYSQNTIANAIKIIKTICYHARNNGIETHFQLNNIQSKSQKVIKIFLTIEELERIQKTVLLADYLDNARDWLIISCETGQRVSDLLKFTMNQIRHEESVPLIEFTQMKTGKIMAVPLSNVVRLILEKRGGEFPRKISDQKYNQYIKEVCLKAGICQVVQGSKIDQKTKRKVSGMYQKHELVSSHIGRRSFATNNYGKIPTSLLIGATGHSTEKMFLEYIGKSNTEKAKQLAEYFV